MPILDAIRAILGFTPSPTGELNRRATHSPASVKRVVEPISAPADIEIVPEYRIARELLDAGAPILFVTGKAGTGKSTFVQYLRQSLSGRVVVVAPTGVAALNVQGATIHSFFRFPPRVLSENDVHPVADRRLYTSLDVLIIDEVSMVRADMIDAIDRFLRLNGKDGSKPFGGTQVVMVGDLHQLPPVVATKKEATLFTRRYTSPFFFSAKALSNEIIAPVELERVFRQQDPDFVELLSRIRLGDSDRALLARINSRIVILAEPPTHGVITLTSTNARADEINASQLDALPGGAREYEGAVLGRLDIEEDRLPSPLHLRLKVNARVMFTKNDPARRWVNGSLGVVTEMKPDVIAVQLEDQGKAVVTVERVSWEKYRYVYDEAKDEIHSEVVASYTQFPLMPAWAITVHKSQGKTLPAVKIDLAGGAFAGGQTYVALSRVRKLEDIWLPRAIRPEDVFCDPTVRRFYAALFHRPLDYGLGATRQKDNWALSQQPPTVTEATRTGQPTSLDNTRMDAPLIRTLIEQAMNSGEGVSIEYTDYSGNSTSRTIHPRFWVDGDRFTAFCELRQAERDFRVSRITRCRIDVSPIKETPAKQYAIFQKQLAEAAAEARWVYLVYHKDEEYLKAGEEVVSKLWVLPLTALWLSDEGFWHFTAWDYDKSAGRIFRVDRIVEYAVGRGLTEEDAQYATIVDMQPQVRKVVEGRQKEMVMGTTPNAIDKSALDAGALQDYLDYLGGLRS